MKNIYNISKWQFIALVAFAIILGLIYLEGIPSLVVLFLIIFYSIGYISNWRRNQSNKSSSGETM